MKNLIITAALLSSVSLPAMAQDLNPQPLPPAEMYASEVPADFYFSLEALALGRSNTDTELFLFDDGSGFRGSTRDFAPLSTAGGGRFTAGVAIDDAWGVEIGAMGSSQFTASSLQVTTAGDNYMAAYSSTATPGNLFFSNSESAHAFRFSESSSVESIEASATFNMGDFKLFAGPRVLRYQASLETVFYDEANDLAGTDFGTDTVRIKSTNTLVGGQIGIDGMYDLNDMFRIGGRAAVGLYANLASLDRYYADGYGGGSSPFTGNPGTVTGTSTATGFAQVVEFSPKISVAVTENLDLSLGGTWLWVNGVDEPGNHYAGIGNASGGAGFGADAPGFSNGVSFAGITAGLHGQF